MPVPSRRRTPKTRPTPRPWRRLWCERLEDRTVPAMFTVTTTADAGAGSLRQAIIDANANPGADTIQFAIASGQRTINLLSELPHITETVTLDGTTQPGFAGAPLVELTGTAAGYANGLWLEAGASGSDVRGLVINRFQANGIVLDHTQDVVIEGNYVGTNADGSGPTEPGTPDPSGNVSAGVILLGGTDNLIGGTTAAARNVISLNMGDGVSVDGDATNLHNVIAGNYIGLDASGTTAMPNYTGVEIENVTSGVPGVPLDGLAVVTGNVISGNLLDGILGHGLWDWSGIVIQGNFIGTNAAGTAAVGNTRYGIDLGADQFLHVSGNLIGGTTAGARNVISGNGIAGIWLGGNGLPESMAHNTIEGNYIGTNAAGTAAIPNLGHGIDMDFTDDNTFGGAAPDTGNVISGNGQNGIRINRSNRIVVEGNFIGTNAAGTAAVGNGLAGVDVGDYGVSSGTQIGGPSAGARNVISGNVQDGVVVHATGYDPLNPQGFDSQIQGNYIGTNAVGTGAVPNGGVGILAANAFYLPFSLLIGGAAAGAGNLISGNASYGYEDAATGTHLLGNRIGTNAAGSAAVPNLDGVFILFGGGQIGGAGQGEGNLISGNAQFGILFSNGGGAIQGNLIGTNADGKGALGNGLDGIAVVASTPLLIGGTTAGARNTISGNGGHGISISVAGGTGGPQITVQGNFIGTDITGTAGLGNGGDGVDIANGAIFNIIGGTAVGARNLISGNVGNGVEMIGVGTSGNLVEGNFIGTDVTGTAPLGNGDDGVRIDGGSDNNLIGGTSAGARNIISGNAANGIQITDSTTATTGNIIRGNYIGTDATGMAAVGNGNAGIQISGGYAQGNTIGGTATGAGNLISGNSNYGVFCFGDYGGVIEGNLIGVNAADTGPISNSTGMQIDYSGNVTIGGTEPGAGNVINENLNFDQDYGAVIQGNYFGTNPSGTVVFSTDGIPIRLSGSHNLIGGTAASAGNVVVGSSQIAIRVVLGTGNVIQGNYIGTNRASAILGNVGGIYVSAGATDTLIGGSSPGAGNVIGCNSAYGIAFDGSDTPLTYPLTTTGNVVQGNFIGTNAAGANLGNGVGVLFHAYNQFNNTIGGTDAGAGNTIAFNRGAGVDFESTAGTGNAIRGNSINGNGGLGIDLGDDGVTLNDSVGHDGPNHFQNFPVIASVGSSGGATTITGTLRSAPNSTFALDFYANTTADPSGYGEGETYLGTANVTTDGTGAASFAALLPVAVPAGQVVTATATNLATGDTSEFSADFAGPSNPPPASLSGIVWKDFNDDGQVDFGETGIHGIIIALAGTDDLGRAINLSQATDTDGAYVFLNLRPGTYRITETQPAGYLQGIDTIGTAGGSLAGTDQFSVSLSAGVNGLNYNFGEQPASTGPVQHGQTATIGFWNNKNGQALIKAFNGGAGTELADWLADTMPHTFGANAGSNNLTHKSNAYVANQFQQDFVLKGVKLDAQVLATALNVYATNGTLDSTRAAAQYGFTVNGDGVGAAGVNVGSDGAAFGVANNTTMTVMDLLKATDAQSLNGVLFGGNATKRNMANDIFSAINQAGGL
jgi:hypothetical protein